MRKHIAAILICSSLAVSSVSSVSGSGLAESAETEVFAGETASDQSSIAESPAGVSTETEFDIPQIPGLSVESKLKTTYAEGFDVYILSGGYRLIEVHDDTTYLVVPEGADVPEGTDPEIVPLYEPLDQVYLAATSAMSLVSAIGALDSVTMTGTDASGWTFDAPVSALESGKMRFAGKYSTPDYEQLVSSDCNLAIESTMIYHNPEVKEMLETLGIPVFVDHASAEVHPLGRTEWILLYGAMFGKEEEAQKVFDDQKAIARKYEDVKPTGKTVVYFAINSDGSISIRKTDDYIPSMIRMAGGEYAFDGFGTEIGSVSGAASISMEEFYARAVDADVLIYNATIESELTSIEDLTAKNELFSEFKAVREGNVWQTGKELYQATDHVAEFIEDVHIMLTGGSDADCTFLKKLS